jgi:hypothetical protein
MVNMEIITDWLASNKILEEMDWDWRWGVANISLN